MEREFYIAKYLNKENNKKEARLFNSYEDAVSFCDNKFLDNVRIFKANSVEEAKEILESVSDKKIKKIKDKNNTPIGKTNNTVSDEIENKTYLDLSESQKQAYDLLLSGKNVFITGAAGVGKSFLINMFMKHCEEKGIRVVLTGSTGIAAENIGGITIHKAIGIPWNDLKDLINKDWTKANRNSKELLRHTDVLIIDEISMIDYATFEYIVAMLKHSNLIRNSFRLPDTQLVVVGDFLQLSPVITDTISVFSQYYPDYGEGYCFQSQAWKDMNFKIVKLREVMRQSEKEYIDALTKLKIGDYSVKNYFNKRLTNVMDIPSNAIYLYGRNDEVNKKNRESLEKLEGQSYVFTNEVLKAKTFNNKINLIFPERLEIKVGARVMAVQNDKQQQYQNGTLGTVLAITETKIFVQFDNGNSVPVQRATEDHFTYKVAFNEEIGKMDIIKVWEYSETNFPLKLAYAITIHKSQGQTFDHVAIHPSCFANGQLYVALSRCRTFDGIYLLREITPSDIKTSLTVIDFERENDLLD